MSKLIIVAGMPGVGKTTLAKELSKKLNIPCIHKDSFKENLFDIMGGESIDDSKKIGLYSVKLMLKIIEEQVGRNIDLIIEGTFHINEDIKLINDWKIKNSLDTYSIICEIDKEERMKRFINRKRHKAHNDKKRIEMHEKGIERWWVCEDSFNFSGLPDKKINIITNKPVEILIEKILKQINNS